MSAVVESIADVISDYKTFRSTPEQRLVEHVEEWSKGFWEYCDRSWFGKPEHKTLLEASLAALRLGYFSEQRCIEMLESLRDDSPGQGLPALGDPCWGWLTCEQQGRSQEELVAKVGKRNSSGDGKHFVYLDDGVFSGETLFEDLRRWLSNEAPPHAVLTTVHFFVNNASYWTVIDALKTDFERKHCRLEPNAFIFLADSLDTEESIDEALPPYERLRLFPTQEMYESAHLDSYRKRDRARRCHVGLQLPHDVPKDDLLGGPRHRYVLTRAFLEVGAKIINRVQQPSRRLAPLGFTDPPSLGLGALVATFRNCPNNAPLALWYEVPRKDLWHPLLPRHNAWSA